jgi:hypothetical protein
LLPRTDVGAGLIVAGVVVDGLFSREEKAGNAARLFPQHDISFKFIGDQ